ncbi:hypothetical protein HNQ62_002937 [Sulfurisphaera ohwakuensis]|uniref:Uncharacterized protein n=1 Tax=Sulfurisphaera ohwakuensis TaxID=69656 RepID=A0A7J9RY34_SULOH|nr:hypothetical protein [Sulfurisphaera ohwakuensis]
MEEKNIKIDRKIRHISILLLKNLKINQKNKRKTMFVYQR